MSFHVNNAGNPGLCSAQPGRCPFGAEAPHYETKEAARAAFELSMETENSTMNSMIVLSSNFGVVNVLNGDLSNREARVALSGGLCGDLALAIHRLTGATPYFLINSYIDEKQLAEAFIENPNSIIAYSSHVVVESLTEPGCFIDSYGQQDNESLQDFWEPGAIIKGTTAMLEHYADADNSARLHKFAKAALALDTAGSSYAYDELDEYSYENDEDEDEED